MSFETNRFFLACADYQQGRPSRFCTISPIHRSRAVIFVRWSRLWKRVTIPGRHSIWIFSALVFVLVTESSLSVAQTGPTNLPIAFNIPAQPLSAALMAYGEASGFEIIYKTSLVEHARSGEVIGFLMPSDALRILLDGTGYVAKTIEPGVFTIVQDSTDAIDGGGEPNVARRRRLEPYFATIQPLISKALCRRDGTPIEAHDVVVQFWLGSNGVIARAEVLRNNGELADDQTPTIPLLGMQVSAPPSDMPQPVTMIVFPAADRAETCVPGKTQHRAG
jgi:hypothetical protein